MDYPIELCSLVIKNMEIVEEIPGVMAHVEQKLFAAIGERIDHLVARPGDWRSNCCIDSVEMFFMPLTWPQDDEDGYQAWYCLGYTEAGENCEWLSCATGVRNSALSLEFGMDKSWCGLNAKNYRKRLNDFYAATPDIYEAGFHVTKSGSIYRPFFFEGAKVAEECPDFDTALAPLDMAMNDLFKAHSAFDALVREFMEV